MSGLIVRLGDREPNVSPSAFVAPSADIVGSVGLADHASVWYGCVLRADIETITVGEGSNIQDGSVVHADPGFPATIGRDVSVGHRAVLHGCVISDGVLIGMGAVVLNGARVGAGSLIAAGAVVTEGTEIPPGTLVAGVPGKVRRELTEAERHRLAANAEVYRALAAEHRAALER